MNQRYDLPTPLRVDHEERARVGEDYRRAAEQCAGSGNFRAATAYTELYIESMFDIEVEE